MARGREWVPVNVNEDVHREMKIASAHRGESIAALLRKAWDAFKAREGKRLHDPVEKKSDAA